MPSQWKGGASGGRGSQAEGSGGGMDGNSGGAGMQQSIASEMG